MKIYSTETDEYGWPVDSHEFLSNVRWASHSGWRWSIKMEMNIHNFFVRIVNSIKGNK